MTRVQLVQIYLFVSSSWTLVEIVLHTPVVPTGNSTLGSLLYYTQRPILLPILFDHKSPIPVRWHLTATPRKVFVGPDQTCRSSCVCLSYLLLLTSCLIYAYICSIFEHILAGRWLLLNVTHTVAVRINNSCGRVGERILLSLVLRIGQASCCSVVLRGYKEREEFATGQIHLWLSDQLHLNKDACFGLRQAQL